MRFITHQQTHSRSQQSRHFQHIVLFIIHSQYPLELLPRLHVQPLHLRLHLLLLLPPLLLPLHLLLLFLSLTRPSHSHILPVSQLVVQVEHGTVASRTDETVTLGTEGQIGVATTIGDSPATLPQVVAMTDSTGDEVVGEEAHGLLLEGRLDDAGFVEQRNVHPIHVGVSSVASLFVVASSLDESLQSHSQSPPLTRRRRLRCVGRRESCPVTLPPHPFARSSPLGRHFHRSRRSNTPNRPRSSPRRRQADGGVASPAPHTRCQSPLGSTRQPLTAIPVPRSRRRCC